MTSKHEMMIISKSTVMLTVKTAYSNYFRCILACYALLIFEDFMNFSISIN